MKHALQTFEKEGKEKERKLKAGALTPTQAQETFADNAVAQTTSDSHVGLPSFCQHPAERREEEEVQQSSHESAHHLWGARRKVRWRQKMRNLLVTLLTVFKLSVQRSLVERRVQKDGG